MSQNSKKGNKAEIIQNFGDDNDRRIQVCEYAPEWAEHARWYEDSNPCEDGRAGLTVCGKRKGEVPCPIA